MGYQSSGYQSSDEEDDNFVICLKGRVKGVEKNADGQLIISDADALAKERQTPSV